MLFFSEKDGKDIDNTRESILFLLSHRNDYNAIPDGDNSIRKIANKYLCDVELFFYEYMYPIELNKNKWLMFSVELKEILDAAEKILEDVYSPEEVNGAKTENDRGKSMTSPKIISQIIDVHYCVLYYYSFMPKEHNKRLKKILESTKRNITYRIGMSSEESISDFVRAKPEYYFEANFWSQPLEYLYCEFGFDFISKKVIAIYEEYIRFLKEYQVNDAYQGSIRDHYMWAAENQLLDLKFRLDDYTEIAKE